MRIGLRSFDCIMPSHAASFFFFGGACLATCLPLSHTEANMSPAANRAGSEIPLWLFIAVITCTTALSIHAHGLALLVPATYRGTAYRLTPFPSIYMSLVVCMRVSCPYVVLSSFVWPSPALSEWQQR